MSVERALAAVALHGTHLVRSAVIIPLAVSPVGAFHRVAADVDRPIAAIGARYFDDDNPVSLRLDYAYVHRRENVDACDGGIVDENQKVLRKSLRIRQTDGVKRFVRAFLHAKENHPADGVGKSGVCLPDAARQTADGPFRLDPVVFPVFAELLKIDHTSRLPRPRGLFSLYCSMPGKA